MWDLMLLCVGTVTGSGLSRGTHEELRLAPSIKLGIVR